MSTDLYQRVAERAARADILITTAGIAEIDRFLDEEKDAERRAPGTNDRRRP